MENKMSPHALDLEKAILGAILLDRSILDTVASIVFTEAFYSEVHQFIFDAMKNLSLRFQPIDILTVSDQLKKEKRLEICGGRSYIMSLSHDVVSTANIEPHCRILLQKFVNRNLMQLFQQGYLDSAEDLDCFKTIDDVLLKIDKMENRIARMETTRPETDLHKSIDRLNTRQKSTLKLTGLPSGFSELDSITNGWQDTDLIVLAARPSVGKTALALQFAMAAQAVKPVLFFSLESSREQLYDRMLSCLAEFPLAKIRSGDLTETELNEIVIKKGATKLEIMQLWINDTASVNWLYVRSVARRLKKQHGVGMIIVDYLQLMNDVPDKEHRTREQQISNISKNLKAIAKDLHIPVIAISQLSRAVEARAGKEPVLSDLRESGAIEQDADVVALIYRPDFYQAPTATLNASNGDTFIKIAKHRHGALGIAKLVSRLQVQRFYSPYDIALKGIAYKTPNNIGRPYLTDDFDEGIKSDDEITDSREQGLR
jgi:replicative DNA helicase